MIRVWTWIRNSECTDPDPGVQFIMDPSDPDLQRRNILVGRVPSQYFYCIKYCQTPMFYNPPV
jgi:hypothetical protein